MAEYGGPHSKGRTTSFTGPAEVIRRTFTRTSEQSHGSVAPSTISWVMQNQQNPPGPPPPAPVLLPSPVPTVRPLPNIDAHRATLHAMNPEPLEAEDEEYTQVDPHTPGLDFQYRSDDQWRSKEQPPLPPISHPRIEKKSSFVGGFVKGMRRLPKAMFGGASPKKPPRRRLVFETNATSMDITGITGNTLPLYVSNPPTPIGGSFARRYNRPMHLPEPPIRESMPPDVIRLSDHHPHRVTPRVSPPSPGIANAEQAEFYDGPSADEPEFDETEFESPPSQSMPTPADRTTFMVYTDHEAPYPVSRQISHRLSYAPSEHPMTRSTSTHAPPPITIPQRKSTPGPHVSYASQAVPRRPPPQIQQEVEMPSTPPMPDSPQDLRPPPPIRSPEEVPESPVNAHPLPTTDYRNMTISPTPASRRTFTTLTSYCDFSFLSELHPIEKFFKLLYNLPWIARERVTIDYMPSDAGRGKIKKKLKRPMASWYHAVLSHSRRNSASIDLLSSGSPSQKTRTSQTTSLGPMVSPTSDDPADRRRRHHHQEKPRHGRQHHRQHHQHQHHSTRRKHRRTAASATESEASSKYAVSPFPPATYPLPYHPYPYTYPFPMPHPAASGMLAAPIAAPSAESSHVESEAESEADHAQKPRRENIPPSLQPGYPHGYSPYQPMLAPPVYLVHPHSPPANANAALPQADGGKSGKGKSSHPQPGSTRARVVGPVYVQTGPPGAFKQESVFADSSTAGSEAPPAAAAVAA